MAISFDNVLLFLVLVINLSITRRDGSLNLPNLVNLMLPPQLRLTKNGMELGGIGRYLGLQWKLLNLPPQYNPDIWRLSRPNLNLNYLPNSQLPNNVENFRTLRFASISPRILLEGPGNQFVTTMRLSKSIGLRQDSYILSKSKTLVLIKRWILKYSVSAMAMQV